MSAGAGSAERGRQRLLPLRSSHPGGVRAKRRDADAGEPLLAGLAVPPSTELDGVDIADPRVAERLGERPLVELRISAAAGEAADVEERLGRPRAQYVDELLEGTATVSDCQDAHLRLQSCPSW